MGEKKTFSSLTQKEIVQIYADHVSKPKTEFFQNLGFGIVQAESRGIYIKILEGATEGEEPLELIDCHTSGGVKNLGSHHPEIVKAFREGLDHH